MVALFDNDYITKYRGIGFSFSFGRQRLRDMTVQKKNSSGSYKPQTVTGLSAVPAPNVLLDIAGRVFTEVVAVRAFVAMVLTAFLAQVPGERALLGESRPAHRALEMMRASPSRADVDRLEGPGLAGPTGLLLLMMMIHRMIGQRICASEISK